MARVEIEKSGAATDQANLRPESSNYVPYVDIYAQGDDTVIEVEMPGVDEKSVEVTAENNVLTISGKANVGAPSGHKLVREEFAAGTYRREFELTYDMDKSKIKARVKDGVLRIVVPKGEAAKARKIEIMA